MVKRILDSSSSDLLPSPSSASIWLPRATGFTGSLPAAVIIDQVEAVTSISRPHKRGCREPMDAVSISFGAARRLAAQPHGAQWKRGQLVAAPPAGGARRS